MIYGFGSIQCPLGMRSLLGIPSHQAYLPALFTNGIHSLLADTNTGKQNLHINEITLFQTAGKTPGVKQKIPKKKKKKRERAPVPRRN